jgi:hypothetical protein
MYLFYAKKIQNISPYVKKNFDLMYTYIFFVIIPMSVIQREP